MVFSRSVRQHNPPGSLYRTGISTSIGVADLGSILQYKSLVVIWFNPLESHIMSQSRHPGSNHPKPVYGLNINTWTLQSTENGTCDMTP